MPRKLVRSGMPILELVQGRVRITVVVYLRGLEELAERKLQSFRYQSLQVLSDLVLEVPVVSTVLELGLGSCIPTLCRRRIMNL